MKRFNEIYTTATKKASEEEDKDKIEVSEEAFGICTVIERLSDEINRLGRILKR